MTKRLRWAIYIAGGVLIVVGVVWIFVDRAVSRVPDFYAQAVDRSPEVSKAYGDEFLRGLAAMASDIQKPGRWRATFSADQINGWLATDLPKNHPDALPKDIHNPRVALAPHRATFAVAADVGSDTKVYSIQVDAFAASGDTVAIRLRGVWAGDLPMPKTRLVRELTAAAQEAKLPITWRTNDADPVAYVQIRPSDSGEEPQDLRLRLDAIEIASGAIHISGQTGGDNPHGDDPAGQDR